MARGRLLHKKISASVQVDRLSINAKLLFTWALAHADDDGRLKGDPKYIKAIVVPMLEWSSDQVKEYLEEIKKIGLIDWWKAEDDEMYIQFIKWTDHQKIRKNRYHPSELPTSLNTIVQPKSTKGQPDDNQW